MSVSVSVGSPLRSHIRQAAPPVSSVVMTYASSPVTQALWVNAFAYPDTVPSVEMDAGLLTSSTYRVPL